MAFCQCWRIVSWLVVFAIGFYIFSRTPYYRIRSSLQSSSESGAVEEGNKENEKFLNNETTTTSKSVHNRHIRSLEDGSGKEKSRGRSTITKKKISIKRKKSRSKHRHRHQHHKPRPQIKEATHKYYFSGYSIENLRPRTANKMKPNVSSSRKKPKIKIPAKIPEKIQTPADTKLIKSKLMPKPEKKLNDSISVAINKQPFHFHIPILSGKPVELPPFKELLQTALKYKHPLTVDVPTENKIEPHLTKRQVGESVAIRVERNSPVLDFLDIDRVVMEEYKHNSKKHMAELDQNDGIKRSIERVAPTEQVMQQLVGDKDDLEILKKRAKKAALRERLALLERTLWSSLEMDTNNRLKRKKRQQKPNHHHRVKRGLGKWLKKVFSRKTTSTTTTTERPSKKSRSSSEESSRKKHKNKYDKTTKKSVTMKPHQKNEDPHGDTKIDTLLPKYLRRSSYWERKAASQDYINIPSSSESDSGEEEPQQWFQSKNSKKSGKESKKRFKRGIFDELPFFSFMNDHDPHLLNTRDTANQNRNIFLGNYLASPVERVYRSSPPAETIPLTSISKEELKIVHEIFSNIINDKCYPVNSQILEVLQSTISSVIDNSEWPDMPIPHNRQVDVFLQKVVNCSSDAVNVMAWKSQRSMQMSFSFEDIEEGSPLLRTKRITDFDIQREKRNLLMNTNYVRNGNGESKAVPISEYQLSQLISLMSDLVVDSCANIETILMTSALQLMRSTIEHSFSSLKTSMDTMTNEEADGLIKSLQKCSSFSAKNSRKPPKILMDGQSLQTPSSDSLPQVYNNNFQKAIQFPHHDNPPRQQELVNYWDNILPYSGYPPFQTQMFPPPSPVPAPPLLKSDNFHNIEYDNGMHHQSTVQRSPNNYYYSSSNGYGFNSNSQQPNQNMDPLQIAYSSFQQQIRPKRNSFHLFTVTKPKTSHYGESYNYDVI